MKTKLSVRWFNKWVDKLDNALNMLPEMSGCPHSLYKSLIQNNMTNSKRTALVTAKDMPIALIGLRKRAGNWVPVTHYLLPGCLFPVQEGYLGPVLNALEINLWISLWRNSTPMPECQHIITVERIPTYMVDLSQDYEKNWTKSHMRHVKQARRHCCEFASIVNPPASAEWIIKNCNSKWNAGDKSEHGNLSDKLLVVNYLEKINRHYSVMLMDKGEFIAGLSSIVHQNNLVATHFFRSPEYEKCSVGTYLIDLSLSWAKASGFSKFDMGGEYSDYKRHWAPCVGEKINFHICKSYFAPLQNVKQSFNKTQQKLHSIYESRSDHDS
ncbi:GNAT family N-acetyltransferase [candidate division KSB1 bacterium]|nr:GNAT family N-acetyltransferase [candidate division KSB1 bacterium]